MFKENKYYMHENGLGDACILVHSSVEYATGVELYISWHGVFFNGGIGTEPMDMPGHIFVAKEDIYKWKEYKGELRNV